MDQGAPLNATMRTSVSSLGERRGPILGGDCGRRSKWRFRLVLVSLLPQRGDVVSARPAASTMASNQGPGSRVAR